MHQSYRYSIVKDKSILSIRRYKHDSKKEQQQSLMVAVVVVVVAATAKNRQHTVLGKPKEREK